MGTRVLTRRQVLRWGIGTGAAFAAEQSGLWPSGARAALAAPPPITATAYGGLFERATRETFVACYREKTGGDVLLALGTPNEWIQKILATYHRAPALDVLVSTGSGTYRAIQLGIVERLDVAKVPNLRDVPRMFIDTFGGYAASFDGGTYSLCFNADKVKRPPTTWVELVDRIKKGEFGNRVMWPSINQTAGPEMLWLLAVNFGGNIDNVKPAFDQLRQMKAHVAKFYSDNVSPGNALVAGDIDVAVWLDGRLWALGQKNLGFGYLKPKSIMTTVEYLKVKNSPDSAWAYINCAFDPVQQSAFIKHFPGYFVTNRKATYTPEGRSKLEATVANFTFRDFVFPPFNAIVHRLSQWVDEWNREIGA